MQSGNSSTLEQESALTKYRPDNKKQKTKNKKQKTKKPTTFGWLFLLQINDLLELDVERAMGTSSCP